MCKFKCRICGDGTYISLFKWNIPLAADVKDKPVNCKRYPLEPVICRGCGHVQLKEALDIDLYDNYLYTPSFSRGFQEYITALAENIEKMDWGGAEKSIVEIGSSNGYFLKQMKNRGWNVLGFEPSARLASEAEKSGVQTARIYFGSEDSVEFMKTWGSPSVIVIRHVMEHLDDINSIVQIIGNILNNGLLIIEVPWLLRIIREKQFYAFFHEHLSYFSLRILQELLQKHGFTVTDIKENNLEGGSIAVYACRGKAAMYHSAKISEYVELEKEWCSFEKITAFSNETKQQIDKIRNLVEEERKPGKKVAVWGAGQRGITLLNICGFTKSDICYIVDENENYWWKYALGVNVQIVPPAYIKKYFPDSIIILATGYADEIISDYQDYLSCGGRFIKIIE